MKTFQVITDSTSDVQLKFRDELDIDYLKMVFTIDEKNYDADLEWGGINSKDYYDAMRKGKRSITGLIKAEEVETKFTKYLEKGLDVLYIACSGKLSSSINTAKSYGEEILEKFPGRKIVCFDSLRSNYAEGYMAMKAAELANEGKTLEETVAWLEENKLKFQTYATVGSLEWLKKAGRVKASTAFFGNLIGVKPIILGDANGNNYSYKKVKGRKTSLDELVNTIVERIENPAEADLFIEHADCEQDAKYIADAVKAKANVKNINISVLGPIIGATTGPDTITVNFYGEKVTLVGEE
ncbi:MAG: DegV family protein [Acholeplasmatales bacterium]|nr:DegV family protein [Acholeplasmatales bacterium]